MNPAAFVELAAVRAPVDPDPTWRLEAACRGWPQPEVFFPGRGDTNAVRAARAVCAGCPVREPCLAFALAEHILEGVWGGTSERQRRRLRARNRRTGP